ncbi:MAG: rhomboid family intramembrane serine protease [Actinomycetota bacterium]|nr:rhomboid family intramembrane serine protease [Actinomycetota bacterium]
MSAARRTSVRRGGPVRRLAPILWLVGAMWLLELLDAALAFPLDAFGIVPRSGNGLIGIGAAPFLHLGFGHLLANTTALLVLGSLVLLTSPYFWVVTVSVGLFGGLGVWLVGDPGTLVIGASGLVYGYAAYLVSLAIFRRSLTNIAVAVLVVLLYGGFVFGVLPGRAGVSWQGHLLGAVVGVLMARWHARTAPRRAWRG